MVKTKARHCLLERVYRGEVAQYQAFATAMHKQPVDEALFLDWTGLAGDQCADLRHHGGRERALHQYPAEHYAYWHERYGIKFQQQAPAMGENLSGWGMTEDTVCLGDRYQWGDAIIEVSQPRSPCFKLSERYGIADLSQHMQDISRCGWLYRVLQTGEVSVTAPLVLLERPQQALTVKETCERFFGNPLDPEGLQQLAAQAALSESWQTKVQQRIATGTVENWNFRLYGHA